MKKLKINFNELFGNHKVSVLVGSILAIVLGILIMIAPYAGGGVITWFAIAVFGLFGLACVLNFILPRPGEKRNVAALIFGLLDLAIVILVIILACVLPPVTVEGVVLNGFQRVTAGLLVFFSIFFGVFAIVAALEYLVSCIGERGKDMWIGIILAIISLALGILMVIFPAFMVGVAMIVAGAYVVVTSIILIILDIKYWKKKPEEINIEL